MKTHLWSFGTEHLCIVTRRSVESWFWSVVHLASGRVVVHATRNRPSALAAWQSAQRAAVKAGVSPVGRQLY
jgi:hypothetical protein